ncbi:valine--tRNA ligase [Buchnera aphidicola (Hyadaphis tataricae)]|uniref:Valine--tRNA ligase n=1 Tax=Buchnera aphidicola (Hyadaphis tataricae) TaxID=1241859 RepID=A0A4D6XZP9_9GAMM|nr:valine--tRNA ligase [Buchnera aphidicola]QCI21659.1 valine--tRNA ligase [Buchnera aphidicola (Hyadaphis tataricae)]
MEKNYNPNSIETSLYNFWENNGYFKPNDVTKPTFCIMMPPPNITGSLHMGHAFQQTIIDILVRYHRMQGKNTLLQAGTDHAGIATQILVERQIFLEERKTKKDYSREDFVKKVWSWKQTYNNIVINQMRRLGVSADWDRTKFTLDSDISIAVKEAFILFYKNNLIYQKKKLVHWDAVLETVISDLEVEHRLEKGKTWFIRYPIVNPKNFLNGNVKYLIVSTTRPETLLGDTAIAVNPKDSKNNQLIGHFVRCPIINRIIPIIGDEYANPQKGTGCVKITPAHDFNDYKVGYRHKLPMINVFTFNGKIRSFSQIFNYKGEKIDLYDNAIPSLFQKLDILSARTKIIEEIKKLGFLENIQESDITVPYNDRSGSVIHSMLTNQWYLKTSKLAKIALSAVEDEKIKFIPEQYKTMYRSWMNNIEDWCISRQLWWGHRIPVWYDDKKNIYVGHDEQTIRKEYSLSKNILLKQDDDVLDTWFSSGLWTFSTLGWPKKTVWLNLFHPTDVLVSGFDIIFFWIARMIMLTMYLMKSKNGISEVPFKNIYVTGLIRDEQGVKMSKSKGNVIDPLDMIDGISLKNLIKKRTRHLLQPSLFEKIVKYTQKKFPTGIEATGTDALRFTFSALASNTRDINWDMNRLKGYRNFCNKFWNASRFVLINATNHSFSTLNFQENIFLINEWILTKLNNMVKLYRDALDHYRFDSAANILYNFVWNIFCDWYLEFAKILIKHGSEQEVYFTKNTMLYVLEFLLRLAHPIIPFMTEEIWQRVKIINKVSGDTIMLQPFPQYNKNISNIEVIQNVQWIIEIIIFVRNIRSNMHIHPHKLLPLCLYKVNLKQKKIIKENTFLLKKIAFLESITILFKDYEQDLYIKKIIHGVEIIIPILKLIDVKLELQRLKKEKISIQKKIFIIKNKLSNKNFLSFAPEIVVKNEKNRFLTLNKIYQELSKQIKKLIHLDDDENLK